MVLPVNLQVEKESLHAEATLLDLRHAWLWRELAAALLRREREESEFLLS